MNRLGQIFPIYLVLLTLFFCFTVFALYVAQGENVVLKLVSPKEVLTTYDDMKAYGIVEEDLLVKVADEMNFDEVESSSYGAEFREKFLTKILANKELSSLFVQGAELAGEKIPENGKEEFFRKVVYPSSAFNVKDRVLEFRRGEVTKHLILESGQGNFPINFYYTFSRDLDFDLFTKKIILGDEL